MVTSESLAAAYFKKALARRKALQVLMDEQSHSDVVREAQELVELVLKGVLRKIQIEPPRIHDVGKIIVQNAPLLPDAMAIDVHKIARISLQLRKDRELSFYGAEDVDPWSDYSLDDAKEAIQWADDVLNWAMEMIDD